MHYAEQIPGNSSNVRDEDGLIVDAGACVEMLGSSKQVKKAASAKFTALDLIGGVRMPSRAPVSMVVAIENKYVSIMLMIFCSYTFVYPPIGHGCLWWIISSVKITSR